MPRVKRGLADGMIYHVINRGNCRQEVFHTDADFHAFVNLLGEAKEKHQVKLLAYCLMSNHFHLLLSPEKADDLSKFMQWLMTSHVRRYHHHYRSSGHVWQGRYKNFLVQDDAHLVAVARYIEGNPVRSGLVVSAPQWPWSSHRERVKSDGKLLALLPVPLPQEWTKYVDEPMTESELERINTSVRRQRPLGWPGWQVRVCRDLGLESTMNPRGRPGKWGQEK